MRHLARALGAFLHEITRPTEEAAEIVAGAAPYGSHPDPNHAHRVALRELQELSGAHGNADPRVFVCEIAPTSDLIRAIEAHSDGTNVVAIEAASQTGASVSVVLSPPRARRFAALVLNLADRAEGATPLVFVPRNPGEEQPA
jgi:hypothetical protein